jgi:hypothetical protein
MNNKNLIPASLREARERKKLGAKGGKKSGEARRKNKKHQEEQKALAEILKDFVYTEVKIEELKEILKSFGASDNNYFAALAASALIKSIKKGDINALAKIMELLGESGKDSNSDDDKSFNSLIEAIKNV